jgi:hypothetical protein
MINVRVLGIRKGYVSGVIAITWLINAPRWLIGCEKTREDQEQYHPDEDENVPKSDMLHIDIERAVECGDQ